MLVMWINKVICQVFIYKMPKLKKKKEEKKFIKSLIEKKEVSNTKLRKKS